jgi:hypothetical protein
VKKKKKTLINLKKRAKEKEGSRLMMMTLIALKMAENRWGARSVSATQPRLTRLSVHEPSPATKKAMPVRGIL